MLVELVAVWLRARHKKDAGCIDKVRAVFQRVNNPKVPSAQLVMAVFDHRFWIPDNVEHISPPEWDDLAVMIRRNELHRKDSIWLLSTLSDLCSEGWIKEEESFLIGICLEVLLNNAPKWHSIDPSDIVLLEAVVTLAAISCSSDKAYQLKILTNSRLLSLRLLPYGVS